MKKGVIVAIASVLFLASIFTIFIFNARRQNQNVKYGNEIADTEVAKSEDDIYIKNGEEVKDSEFSLEDDFVKLQKIDKTLNKITDYGKGFTMSYYNDMSVDTSLSKFKTTMFNDDTTIEVYYDDFTDTDITYEAYKNYSNNFIENYPEEHKKEFESEEKINGREAHVLMWSRDKLKNVENDKNHYVSIEMKSNNNESDVYTIFMKSAKPFKTKGKGSYKEIVDSFRIIEKQATAKINTKFKVNENRKLNSETEELYKKHFLESNKLEWGIFENTAPTKMDFLNELEAKMDYDFKFLVKYQGFSSPDKAAIEELQTAYEQGKTVELTLQTTYEEKSNFEGMYDILDGKYDSYFKEYANNLKDFNHPVLFRLNNEMNGDWCEYSAYHYSKDTDIFNEVWRYIHNIFEKEGVENVLWVWNPHDISFPKFNWNHYLNYYPGDEYVDIVGLTGYNNGTYYEGEVWRDFEEIYDPVYEEYSEIFEQPLMITEFSANSVGGDKIEWINDMFDKMKKYDRIKVAIWWNGIDWDEDMNPARIYRLDESEEMLNTFKEGFKKYK